jgi:hypothetical protein
MAEPFYDVSDEQLAGNVQQCGDCAALVLKSNATNHGGWHEWLAEEITRLAREAIADYVAARAPGRPPGDRRLSLRPRGD